MKKILIAAVLLLALAGCGTQSASQSSSHSHASVHRAQPKRPKRPNTKAGIDDLTGHYWVNTTDKDQVLQITASTDGYFLDVQQYAKDQAAYTTTNAGVFAAKLTLTKHTYTFTGTPQPHAKLATWQFKKLATTRIKQLPDGPVFRRVKDDDLTTLKP